MEIDHKTRERIKTMARQAGMPVTDADIDRAAAKATAKVEDLKLLPLRQHLYFHHKDVGSTMGLGIFTLKQIHEETKETFDHPAHHPWDPVEEVVDGAGATEVSRDGA